MTETPQERARRLMDECDQRPNKTYSRGDVKLILNNIACMVASQPEEPPGKPAAPDAEGCRAPVKVSEIRRGDVFIASTIGGKVRPWVVLHLRGDAVVAVAMSASASDLLGMHPSRCRFWPNSYLGATVTAFTKEHATQQVTRPYTARAHLGEIEADFLKMVQGPRRRKKAKLVSITRRTA